MENKQDEAKRTTRWALVDEEAEQRLFEAAGEDSVIKRAFGSEPKHEHPYNLYRDITSGPQALRDTFEWVKEDVAVVAEEIVKRKLRRILTTGLGTSQFVAMPAAVGFCNLAHADADQVDSAEFLTSNRDWDLPHTAFLAYSGSGFTVDCIRAAEKAKKEGAYTIGITSVADSPLTKICDASILCAGGWDTGASDTFHLITRLGASFLLALEVGERTQPNAMNYKNLREQLFAVPDLMEGKAKEIDSRCRNIARQYKNKRCFLVVGGGPNLGAAEEFALKLDEIANIPSKAMCPTRNIHGVTNLLDEDIVTVIIAPPSASYSWLMDVAKLTQVLKTPSIGVVTEDDDQLSKIMDNVVRLPVSDETFFTLPVAFVGELLAYYCSVEQGLNPDCGRYNIPKYARGLHMLFPPDSH